MLKEIHSKISQAETIESSFYLDNEIFNKLGKQIFDRSWHFVGKESALFSGNISQVPFDYYPKLSGESLALTKNAAGKVQCFSNVCTHRAFQLIHHPSAGNKIVCQYHGRRFNLDGQFEFMPEFKEAENFPRPCDHLAKMSLSNWKDFLFMSINPAFDWSEIAEILDKRIGFLPIEQFKLSPTYSKEYLVQANWALYVDNYLEGFHIPFVHQELNQILDYGQYEYLLYKHCNLQIAYASNSDFYFDLPKGHIDYGKKITAYYYWVFPNLMFNFYPWGVQINIINPLGIDRCKVSFFNYIYDQEMWDRLGVEALSEKVEREDEFVVESVQRGLKSQFYSTGRYSPTKEQGVHHFHRLAVNYLNGS